MRVLLVNSYHYYRGGDCTYTFALADLLRSRGHEVAFFAMHHPSNLPDPDSDLFVSFIDFRDSLRRRGLKDGVRVLSRAIYSREARAKFGKMVDRFQPDLVHFQNILAHITPSVILETSKRQLPSAWTLHDYKMLCPNSHFLIDRTRRICEACTGGGYYHAVINRCKKGSVLASGVAALEAYVHRYMRVNRHVGAFVSPSEFMRRKLIGGGFPHHKVRHIPLFLPEEAFGDDCGDDGYLLFLGRLEPIKGIQPLIEASRLAPEVPLMLAGSADAAMQSSLPAMLPRNAKYVGMKRGAELRTLLRGARAVVLPSVCYENQPFSILEAFAAGKPVIGSDLGGIPELVEHGERGLLVPPGDASALADGMRWMTSHWREAGAMGRSAQQYVRANHSPAAHYVKVMALYRELTQARRSPQGEGETPMSEQRLKKAV